MYYLNLAFASLWMASMLAVTGGTQIDSTVFMYMASGMFGGAITQCITADERKPPMLVIVGEMGAALVMGVAAYAMTGNHDLKTLIMSAGMGGGGSLSWSKLVKKYQDLMGK